ncbi:MAG: tRNA glutamyl-Q(34) synthetase GluQRS [Deltaproteobacteria bacterium]
MRTRFAPSPTGFLHLGHAFSAITAHDLARVMGGKFLLRIEDLDPARCRPEFEAAIVEDLAWMGLAPDEPTVRQSDRQEIYTNSLNSLADMDLIYPCRCTRGDIQAALAAPQEGVAAQAVYPGTCRHRKIADAGPNDAIRLNLTKALTHLSDLSFAEISPLQSGTHKIDPSELVKTEGDVVLQRRDTGLAAYHLAVVVDDAAQNISHVVRGMDLFEATGIQRVLKSLLTLPAPIYLHHRLIRDENGKRLAKRDDARAIRRYREDGLSSEDLRALIA